MVTYLNKWVCTIKISLTKLMAYRLDFFLQVIGPALVFFFIKYNLWIAIYGDDSQLVLKGYNLQQMLAYHGWVLVISLLAQGHNGVNMARDIRHGRISSYLIYPFQFWEFHMGQFLAFEVSQLFISIITIVVLSALAVFIIPSFKVLLLGIFSCLIISFFWFQIQFLTGILSFWLEETWMMRVMFMIISNFLSGAILPLDMFPNAFRAVLEWSPFPYLTYYPIRIFMGHEVNLTRGIGIILVWAFALIIINRKVWNKGIRMYTAAGM